MQETIQQESVQNSGKNFQDIEGKSKVLKRRNGKLCLTGNENYISTVDGVIHHQTARTFKRVAHISGFNKIM